MLYRTYKFRLYPTPEQEEILHYHFKLCRDFYNILIENLSIIKEETGRVPSEFDTNRAIPELKKENPELQNLYSKVLYGVVHQVYANLRGLSRLKKKGKKIGRFRLKEKWSHLTYLQQGFKLIDTGERLWLLKLGKIGEIPIRVHRPVEGTIKCVVVKQHPSGRWFANIQAEIPEQDKLPSTGREIALKIGVDYFLKDSDGRIIPHPEFYQRTLDRIRYVQSKLNQLEKGSEEYEYYRKRLARLHLKIVNQRDDFLHKLSRFYVDNYDVIRVEDVDIMWIIENSKFKMRVLDASWGKFFSMLEYKAKESGRKLILEKSETMEVVG